MLDLAELGRQIRRRRRHVDWTQSELARAAQVSQSLVAKIEQGHANPSYESVRLLLAALEGQETAREISAAHIMQQAVTADPAETVAKALGRMKKQGFSQMPVVDLGRPVGSLSERSVLEHVERGTSLEVLRKKRVSDLMGEAFPTVDERAGRRVLVELLKENEAVLVLRKGKLVGVVTRTDLL